MRSTMTSWVLVCALLMLTTDGHAQQDEATAKAKALFEKAEVHFSVGEFEKALDLYRQAYKAKQLPAFLFNIGQCHRYMKEYEKAILSYDRFLAHDPETPHRAKVENLIEQCRKAREQAKKANEKPVKAEEAQPPPSSLSWDEIQRTSEVKDDGEQRRGSPVLLWSGVGLTVALLATATVTGVLTYDKNQEYKEPNTPVARRQELKDSGQPLAVTSVVTGALAGAVAVGTALYYWFGYRTGRPESTVSAAPLPGGGALVLGGAF